MPERRRIALFGGTFDPIHLGHIKIAEMARRSLSLHEVRFLPCRISPHKSGSKPTSTADRLEMLRLATTRLPWAVIDDFETRHDGPSFSYRTAEEMAARYPGARLYWIMGTDQWDVLDSWAHLERLAACVEFIVFSRGNKPAPRDGCVLHVLKGTHPASATDIRKAIACGESGHPWLAPEVADWIAKKKLYRETVS